MSARFHIRGRDPLLRSPLTQWQRERARGAILPMEQPRRSWFSLRRRG
ncbi:hypothetical protein [Sphingobium sp. MI1205]|nr:hypothetical protein [Sphingobium sp. MI1205]